MENKTVNRSGDVVLFLGEKALAGQTQASLVETRAAINITNRINPQWEENIAGTRSWRIQCNGLYVNSANTLSMLQDAFMGNGELTVSITLDGIKYTGTALLTDFPVGAPFGQGLTYRVSLLGTGELTI